MSFRPTILRAPLRQAGAARTLATSAPRRAGGHGDHGHGHASGSIGLDDPAATGGRFFSTPMIASILAIAGLSYYVNYSSSSPSRSPRSGQDPAEESTSIFNFHRMLLPYANAKLWEERRHKLIALESDGAYQRRLFARAERPGIIDNYDTRPDLFASRMKLAVGTPLDTTVEGTDLH